MAFESYRAFLVGELYDDEHSPGATDSGMRAAPCVMRGESCRNVGRQACVVAGGCAFALQDVNRLLAHAADDAKESPFYDRKILRRFPQFVVGRPAFDNRGCANDARRDQDLACQPSTFAAAPLRWTPFACR